MRKDITMLIDSTTSSIVPNKSFTLGIQNENIQGNIIIEMSEFIDGNAMLEVDFKYIHHMQYLCTGDESGTYEINGNTFTMPTVSADDYLYYYPDLNQLTHKHGNTTTQITLTKGTSQNKLNFIEKTKSFYNMTKVGETYVLPIKDTLLLRKGYIDLQLVIREATTSAGTPKFKSEIIEFEIKESIDSTDVTPDEYDDIFDILSNKVDKIPGKSLSTNDYDNTEKSNVANNTSARHTHNNKPLLDSLVSNGSGNKYLSNDGTYKEVQVVGNVDDVKVNNVSVVENKVANIDLTPYAKTNDLGDLASKDTVNYETEVTNKPTIPTKTSDLTNDSGFIDNTYHDNTKVDKVEGKNLSTNDYTTEEKTKLAGLSNYDDTEVRSLIANKQDIMQYSTIPTASSSLVNKIVEYTGTTDSTYTNGYFYQCTDTSTQESITATQTDNVVTLGTINVNANTFKSKVLNAGTYEFIFKGYNTKLVYMNITSFPPVTYNVTRDNTFDRIPMIPGASGMYSWIDDSNNFYVTDTINPSSGTKLYAYDIRTEETTDTGANFISSNTPSQIDGRWYLNENDIHTPVELSEYGIYLTSSGLPGNTIQVNYVAANTSYSWLQKNVQPAGQGGVNWGDITGTLSNQTDLNTALNNKVDVESGKGLSTNDYTTAEKNKLAGIDMSTKQNTLTAGANITINNDVISASGGDTSDVAMYYSSWDYTFTNGTVVSLPNNIKTSFENAINDAYSKGKNAICMLNVSTGNDDNWISAPFTQVVHDLQTKPSLVVFGSSMYGKQHNAYQRIQFIYGQIRIGGSWDGDTFTASYAYWDGRIFSLLSTDNGWAYTPTANYHPATKKYVDDNAYTLPVATSSVLGGVMPDGTTITADANGVISASGGSNIFVEQMPTTSATAFDLFEKENGVYYFENTNDTNKFYYKINSTTSATDFQNINTAQLIKYRSVEEAYADPDINNRRFAVLIGTRKDSSTLNGRIMIYYLKAESNTTIDNNQIGFGQIVTLDNQTFTGIKTFNSLPESSVVPTTANQLTNKTYVDSAISNAITTTLGGNY